MNKFVLAMMAASSLSLIGASAYAMDHHMAGEAAVPTHEDCMALHQELMGDVAHGDTVARDAVLAGLDDETRARADACHAMMAAGHAADGDAMTDQHGDDAPAAEDMHHEEAESDAAEQPQE